MKFIAKTAGTDRLPSVASVDLADESAGQEDNAQDDRHEQPNEGAGAEGALLALLTGQRP